MGFGMARRTKRLWTDEEKRSICFQTKAEGVSVAQVARRYGMNANLIFRWLRDPNFAPDCTSDHAMIDLKSEASFLPVEIVKHGRRDVKCSAHLGTQRTVASTEDGASSGKTGGTIEIDLAGGHRLRIIGAYDPETLARLIRSLSA